MSNPFFIVGPTAVGKTGLAVEVAARTGAEIVSADAFQVYAGLDLLTAKPSTEDRLRVPHHLVGTISLSETYNVARYLDDARACLRSMAARGRPTLVVGGSGLYVKALTHGLSSLPGTDPEIRAELDLLDSPALLERLRELDPEAAAVIDGKNKRRLVRAVEVCLLSGGKFSDFRTAWQVEETGVVQGVFLSRDAAELANRIEQRTDQMFARGVIDEVGRIPPDSVSQTAEQTLGYPLIRAFLSGQIALQECRDAMAAGTRRYAKRQRTWFRAARHFQPLNLSLIASRDQQVEAILRDFRLHQQRPMPPSTA